MPVKRSALPDASVTAEQSTGGPSRLPIMRPVATTLLMVAILLAWDYRLSILTGFGAAGSGLTRRFRW